MDVSDWLRKLGLERYEAAFRDNEIDREALPKLTAEDLKDLGVMLGSHRRKLLEAIAALRSKSGLRRPAADQVASTAERRQLTVMFCDLVGSTELSAQLDPEDLREVIAAYHRAVTDVVRSFDGFVAKYMGDGILVYFGYPRAHEDDAERAVRAGLACVDAVGRLDVKSVRLQARIGIATGLVVVGDLIGEGSAHEQSVVGETPNLAARLQALAEPGTVVIAAGTRRLLGPLFEVRDLGAVEVKGIAGPVPAWQVLRPSAAASRFEALRGSALTPLVGREEEIDLLLRRWVRAQTGDGQVVLISGEPGVGKSRITAELEGRLPPSPTSVCTISALPIIRTAHFTRLSTSSDGRPGSRPTIRPRPGSKSSRLCSPASRRPTRMWHSSSICCRCQLRIATRCRTLVLSGKRKRHWKR
jgi:class 3 adenylate cyclase